MIETSTTGAYVAKPASGSGPGVVVVQEFWGLAPWVKSVCDRLADEGYVALAPDLYHGKLADNPGEAAQLMGALNPDQVVKDMAGAFAVLPQQGAAPGRYGVVGFCMGGHIALMGAAMNDGVAACVDFYGVGAAEPDYRALKGPVLLLTGDQDQRSSPSVLEKQRDAIKAAGRQAELVVYPGCDHAFMNDGRPSYSADAAADAWARMVAHFKANL